MNIKAYLRQIRLLDHEINSKIREKEALYNTLFKIPRLKETMVQESGGGQVDDIYVKILEIEQEINRDIDRLVDLKREVSCFIDTLEDPRYRIVLRDYYLAGHTWKQVAVDNHWSCQHVWRLHGEALQALSERGE